MIDGHNSSGAVTIARGIPGRESEAAVLFSVPSQLGRPIITSAGDSIGVVAPFGCVAPPSGVGGTGAETACFLAAGVHSPSSSFVRSTSAGLFLPAAESVALAFAPGVLALKKNIPFDFDFDEAGADDADDVDDDDKEEEAVVEEEEEEEVAFEEGAAHGDCGGGARPGGPFGTAMAIAGTLSTEAPSSS